MSQRIEAACYVCGGELCDQAGKIPPPIRIGRNVRWDYLELQAWVDARCPDRETWEAMRHG